MGIIQDLRIPLPSLAKQRHFAALVGATSTCGRSSAKPSASPSTSSSPPPASICCCPLNFL